MESPSSTIDSTAAEPKTAAAVAAAASEKENDVVMRKSRKRSSASAAISHLSSRSLIPNVNAANESHGMIQQQQQTQQQPRHQQTQPRDDGNANARTKSARRSSGAAVTPPRPSSSASGDFQDEGTAKVDFERQAHHFQAANVPQKRAKASNKKAVPKKRPANKRRRQKEAAPVAIAKGITAQEEITPALAAFLGTAPKELVARTEVVKRLWAYIKEHDLQTPDDRRTIRLDPSLQDVFGQHVTHFTMFTMHKYITTQLAPYPPVDLTLLSVAKMKDAKNRKQLERYHKNPEVVAKQAERERIAKKKQAELDRKQETKKLSQTINTKVNRLGAELLNNALTNME